MAILGAKTVVETGHKAASMISAAKVGRMRAFLGRDYVRVEVPAPICAL
jgi:hypothetical protein